jgi:Fe-S cluster biogenesis protein NfuA
VSPAAGPSMAADPQLADQVGRVEALIAEIEGWSDSHCQAAARELVQALLDLHREGLARLLEGFARAGPAFSAAVETLAGDELVGSLLALHCLHPQSLEARVARGLENARPFLASHGGDVELVGITEEGAVLLRLKGNCQGCPSSRVTLKHAVEEAIYAAAPEVTAIEVEGAVEQPPLPARDGFAHGFVPASQLQVSIESLLQPAPLPSISAQPLTKED